MTIWRLCIACCIHKATNTHSEFVILIAFPLEHWLHERPSMFLYTYIACRYLDIPSPLTKLLNIQTVCTDYCAAFHSVHSYSQSLIFIPTKCTQYVKYVYLSPVTPTCFGVCYTIFRVKLEVFEQVTHWSIFTQELEGKRRGRPKNRWKEEVERDLQVLGVRRWRELVADRKKWKDIFRQAKAHRGL